MLIWVAIVIVLLVAAVRGGLYLVEQRASDMLEQVLLSAEIRVAATGSPAPSAQLSPSSTPSMDTATPGPMSTTTPTPRGISTPFPTPIPAPRVPDLAVVAMGISPPNPTRGQPITAWIRGINRGNAVAEGIPVQVALEREVLGGWIPVVSVWGTVERLAPGELISMERSATIPDQVLPGKYRVAVEVDPDRTIRDADRSNNRRALEFTID